MWLMLGLSFHPLNPPKIPLEGGRGCYGLNSYAASVPGGDHYQDNEGAPKAFVTIIFFDEDRL
jgi:hypothetical protein